MRAAENLQVQMLFVKSAEDEDTLTFAVKDAVFEFHTQQAIEKLLKVLIAAHGSEFRSACGDGRNGSRFRHRVPFGCHWSELRQYLPDAGGG
jgi:hypothetical protein